MVKNNLAAGPKTVKDRNLFNNVIFCLFLGALFNQPLTLSSILKSKNFEPLLITVKDT